MVAKIRHLRYNGENRRNDEVSLLLTTVKYRQERAAPVGWNDRLFNPQSRRLILQASAIGIIAYSTVVLVYANLVPDLGVHMFGRIVGGLRDTTRQQLTEMNLAIPQDGDRVVSIAGVTTDSLPQYVRTVAELRDTSRFPAHEVTAEELDGLDHPVAEVDGRRFVRVHFEPPEGSGRTHFSTWLEVRDLPWQETAISVVWFAMESLLFWIGWLVFRRRPADDCAAVFFLMCIATVGTYMGGYHWLRVAGSPGLTFIFALCAMAVPQVSLHFYLLYPTPKRFLIKFPLTTVCLLYVIPGIIQLSILWSIGSVVYAFRHDLPLANIQQHLDVLLWLIGVYLCIGGGMYLGCIACLVDSYSKARQPAQKQQVRWILSGSLIASVFIAYSFWLAFRALVFRDPMDFALGRATWAMFAASLVFTFAYAISITRHRLLHVEEISERGFLYFVVRFAGGLCYYGLLLLAIWFSPWISSDTNQGQALLISSFVLLVLLTLTTVRTRIQKLVERRFYRSRIQLQRAVQRMDEAVGKLVDRESVLKRSLLVVRDMLDAREAAIYLRSSEGYSLGQQTVAGNFPETFDRGHPLIAALKEGVLLQATPGPALGDVNAGLLRQLDMEIAQPILLDQELVGFFLIGHKQEGMYETSELGFMAGLAALTSIALHSTQTQETLEQLNQDLRDKIEKLSRQKRVLRTMGSPAISELQRDSQLHLASLCGSSPAVQEMIATVRKVASSQATVLICGESGTGKSLLAELIHRNSPRAEGPFITVHCAALSAGLLESELFGHVRGAFTGAHRDKQGRFQLADCGTLFLDEIGDISLEVQTKLLRVLQEMTFEPVGSSESIRVDVRIIAATHQSLEQLIAAGRFREDLFYRLNVISLRTPALRERREDIPQLVQHFLNRCSQQSKKQVDGIEEEALEALTEYAWPGNIRELENVIERAFVLADGPTITINDLPEEIAFSQVPAAPREWRNPVGVEPAAPPARLPNATVDLAEQIDQIERQRLWEALQAAGGNKSKAASLLGIPRSTFCSKLKRQRLA